MNSLPTDIRKNVSPLANSKRRGSDRVGAQPLHWLVPCQAKASIAKKLLTSFHFPSVRQLSTGHTLTDCTKMYNLYCS